MLLRLLFLLLALPGYAAAAEPLRIIGGPSVGGCIAGAARLPDDGAGYQTIHGANSHFWGAPQTIAGVQALGRAAQAAGLPTLLVEDISYRRGGPMAGGHVTHQTGLDVDIALDMRPRKALSAVERASIAIASLVRPDQRGVEPSRWSADVIALLRMAATLPGVDRVLVNAAIKRQLCEEVVGDRSWLRRIRPWYAHAAHMHIAFACPDGQPECTPLAPPPLGDGCDGTLQWWFDRLDAPPAPPEPRKAPPTPPAACKAILQGGRP